MIPEEKVQEVRDKVDIIDLVGRYVELRRAGRNFKGLCPFHQENSPSFNVNAQRRGYKCFGCGASGDAIRFVMELEGKSFPEAVRKLAELYGVELPASTSRGEPRGPSAHEKDEAYAVTRAACELFEATLLDREKGRTGQTYLETRGLSCEIARRFRLGYAPAPSEAGWDTLCQNLEEQGLSLDAAHQLGLIGRSERTGNLYDKFRGRLMFPIIQPGGEVIAFSGRIVPPHDRDDRGGTPPPKYVNSSESILFTKSKQLFGLATARTAIRSAKRAILVEGNVDVVKLHQWGHEEAVAPLGTALTSEQARLVGRFADQVVLCFDGDRAGKKAAWSALPQLLDADLDVRMVLLPAGEDPDSVGQERFGALLGRSRPALEEMMLRVAAKAGDAAHARGKALDSILPLVARVRSEHARDLYAHRAAELFHLPMQRVEAAISGLRRQAATGARRRPPPEENSRQKSSTSKAHVPLSAAVRPTLPLPAGQSRLAMLLVDVPRLADVAERSGVMDCLTDERLRAIVRGVVEGARQGRQPTLEALLAPLDASEHQKLYANVFAGEYRGLSDNANSRRSVPGRPGRAGGPARASAQADHAGDGPDPHEVLGALIRACRAEQLDQRISEVKSQMRAAEEQGYPDRARELARVWMDLRRDSKQLLSASGPVKLSERNEPPT